MSERIELINNILSAEEDKRPLTLLEKFSLLLERVCEIFIRRFAIQNPPTEKEICTEHQINRRSCEDTEKINRALTHLAILECAYHATNPEEQEILSKLDIFDPPRGQEDTERINRALKHLAILEEAHGETDPKKISKILAKLYSEYDTLPNRGLTTTQKGVMLIHLLSLLSTYLLFPKLPNFTAGLLHRGNPTTRAIELNLPISLLCLPTTEVYDNIPRLGPFQIGSFPPSSVDRTPSPHQEYEQVETNNVLNFFLRDIFRQFVIARYQRLQGMTDEERASWLERIGGQENLSSSRITFAIVGIDSGLGRDDIVDPIFGVPRGREGLADQIHIISIGLDGNITILSLPRDLRVPELGGLPINLATYFYVERDGTVRVRDPSVLRDILEDAIGMPIDATISVNFEAFIEIVNALFPDGLLLTLTPEDAFHIPVTIGEAFPDSALDNRQFLDLLMSKIPPSERDAFLDQYPNPTDDQIRNFLIQRNIVYPPGTYRYSSWELLAFVRARKSAIPFVQESDTGSSTFARESAARIVISQILIQLGRKILSNPFKIEETINQMEETLIQTIQNLEDPQLRSVRVTWDIGGGDLQLSDLLESYFQSLTNSLSDPFTAGQIARLILSSPLDIQINTLDIQDLVTPDGHKLSLAGHNPRSQSPIEYWRPVRALFGQQFAPPRQTTSVEYDVFNPY